MAQQFVTDAGTLIIPGAYPTIKVQTDNSGLATNGVLMLVGEAEAGPDWSLETKISDNSFGPDQIADIVAKYQSGPLVDAARAAAAPANDDAITGSPSRLVLVKTNVSAKASLALAAFSGTYGTLYERLGGKRGNNIYATVDEVVAETIPTTGSFTLLSPQVTTTVAARVNGGSKVTSGNLTAGMLPPAMVSVIDAMSNVVCTGGADRGILGGVSGNISITASGNNVVVSYSGTWDTTPSVGDMFYIPVGSPIAGGSNVNCGSYVITAATSTDISATKLLNATGTGSSLTAPTTVSSQAVAATTDVAAYAPVVITIPSADPVDGIGKTLEISRGSSGEFDVLAYALTADQVSWFSLSGAAEILTSATEYRCQLNLSRASDNLADEILAGGEIALKLGYTGTTATVTITSTTLTTSVSGGSGANLSVTLADYPTLGDLVAFLNAQTGYQAALGTAVMGSLAPTSLDRVSAAGICTTNGEYAGRIKVDAYRFFVQMSRNATAQLGSTEARAAAGIPAPTTATSFFTGGSKGASTNALITAAIDACEQIRGNFLVPLFARDASDDIADGLTDDSSTYDIDSINAYARTHVLKMSTLKRRRNRQAFLSFKGAFTDAKTAAANIASFRCSMCFQDTKNLDSTGTIKQFQPWMSAVLAAGMQAAGFYRPIVHKYPNMSGAIQAAGDFDDQNDTKMEDALLAGLLPLREHETGGFYWVSDQTTYGKDSNFVYNSIQAVYVADLIGLTAARRMEDLFVGQSVADISASIALAALESILGDFLRLKLISPSDDAPRGFKNAQIRISGPTMIVSAEVKLAGAIYFVPINFLVSQVQQTATTSK